MADDKLEQRRELTIHAPVVPAKMLETIAVAENHANYLVDKITASKWVQDLGRNGKVSASMKAAIAYSVAATLEEAHAIDRRYRVADLGFLAKIATYFSPALRPVSISVSSVAPPSEASGREKKGGVFGTLNWSEYALIVTALCTAGAIYYAQQTSGQTAALNGTITANTARISSLEGLLKDSNDKRDEYSDRLVEVNRYLGQLEGQADAQTEQQKKMLAELKSLVGKVDKVIAIKIKSQTATGGTEGPKK